MSDEPMPPRIIAIIVQYGHWQHTAMCVESLLAGTVVPDWVVIVDKASPDASAENFLAWARGDITLDAPDFFPICPTAKPVPLTPLAEYALNVVDAPETRCVFVRMSCNGGYAAGNNVGIRLGLCWGADAFLLLNNDTMVTSDAVSALGAVHAI